MGRRIWTTGVGVAVGITVADIVGSAVGDAVGLVLQAKAIIARKSIPKQI
jgi:hypothetical protein